MKKNTLAQVEKLSSEKLKLVSPSPELPAGHFLGFAKIKGHDHVYLFQGKTGDQRAVIKGHTETKNGSMRAFSGNSLFGGTEFWTWNYKDSFRTMAG